MKSAVWRRRFTASLLFIFLFLTVGCSDEPEYDNTLTSNFDALVEIIDTHYCFLDDKGIDWQEISERYRTQLKDGMTQGEFFTLCASMLDELKDGHVNLSSRWDTSYYRRWWSDYPQDFSLRTIEQYYMDFEWSTAGGMRYKILEDVGYIYYPSFSYTVSETALDNILYLMRDCKALIIDVRNNGGGILTNIDTFVGRFITSTIIGGYIRHKTGPGHSDFSEYYPIEYKPAEEGRIMWTKGVYVLTNRSCFSAANQFVSVMKSLPQVRIVGATTGGGGGMPFTSEMPIGWSVRFSASPVYNSSHQCIEWGVEPTEGFECHAYEAALALGHDDILDLALATIRK